MRQGSVWESQKKKRKKIFLFGVGKKKKSTDEGIEDNV